MAIRLTKNLKRVIVAQFKLGDSLDYLAGIYSVSLPRIEQVIRQALNAGPWTTDDGRPTTKDGVSESTNF